MSHDKKINIINSLRLISICSFILFTVSGSMVFAEVTKVDSNFDGKMDQWRHNTADGKTFKIEYDTNFDGNIDQVEHFVGDKTLVKAEFDADKNGEIDQIQHYSNSGKS